MELRKVLDFVASQRFFFYSEKGERDEQCYSSAYLWGHKGNNVRLLARVLVLSLAVIMLDLAQPRGSTATAGLDYES